MDKSKEITPRHVLIKLLKIIGKERILKASREKWLVTYSGVHKAISEFLAETLQARRDGNDIFKVLKEKKSADQQYCAQ